MLKRKILKYLLDWKNTKKNECLLIKGARQVGKTFIIREFGKNYKNFIELNFLLNKSASQAFEGDLNVDDILMSLSSKIRDINYEPNETLIFLDEIQACPKARTALKSFAIDGTPKTIPADKNTAKNDVMNATKTTYVSESIFIIIISFIYFQ